MKPFLLLLPLVLAGCSAAPVPSTPEPPKPQANDWASQLGKVVTVEGNAANAKLGALLQVAEGAIWIDGLDAWPEGFYLGGDQGKRIRVTGTVIKKADMPVFVEKPGGLQGSGMPVKTEAERERLKWRYLLKDATWQVID